MIRHDHVPLLKLQNLGKEDPDPATCALIWTAEGKERWKERVVGMVSRERTCTRSWRIKKKCQAEAGQALRAHRTAGAEAWVQGSGCLANSGSPEPLGVAERPHPWVRITWSFCQYGVLGLTAAY